MVSRVVKFGHYSVTFEERSDGQYCFVRTLEVNPLLSLCVNVEAPGQRVPHAELSSLSQVVSNLPAGLMPISVLVFFLLFFGLPCSLFRPQHVQEAEGWTE